ncbi:MAG: MFS transporter [Nocardioidaceae bacterium]
MSDAPNDIPGDSPDNIHDDIHRDTHGDSHGADPTGAADAEIASHTSSSRARWELAAVGLGALVVSLSQSLLVPIISVLPYELHTSPSTVTWLLTSTLLVAAVSLPIMGRLGDMFGKKLMLLIAVATLVVGSLMMVFTDNVAVLIAGRVVQGVSMSAIALGISLLSTLLPRERVGTAIALVSAMLGVGGALGLPIAGFVAEHASFHVLFAITAGVGLVAFFAILLIVPESPLRTGGRVDLVGAALLTAGLLCLLIPLTQAADWGWGDPRVAGLLVASLLLIVVLVLVELRTKEPLVDMRALGQRPIILTNLVSILFGFALFASLLGTASFVEAPKESGYGFGSSLMVGGLAMLPSGLAMLFLAPVAAKAITRFGAPQTLTIGAAIVGVGWVARIAFSGSLLQVVIGTTVIGAGTGIGYAALPTLINAHTPPTEIASANGLNSLFRSVGSSLASAIGGSILAANTVILGEFAVPSLGAYHQLFGMCAVAAFAAALLVLLVPRHGRHATA